MVKQGAVLVAVETAWTIYRATHRGVDAADARRCLLERHLNERMEVRQGDVEELASFGLAYLARLPDSE
jgi:hypothetical protein